MSARIPVSEAHGQQKRENLKQRLEVSSVRLKNSLALERRGRIAICCMYRQKQEYYSIHARTYEKNYLNLTFLQGIELLQNNIKKRSCFVKIVPKKNGNFGLALRKRLFCIAKPTLLPCKTAAFGMQNNRFCKAVIIRELCRKQFCEKYLQLLCDLLEMNW